MHVPPLPRRLGQDLLDRLASIACCGNRPWKRASTASTIRSRTMSPLMPPVVANQLMASRSQQSSANAMRTRSRLSQAISKPSEHQRRLLSFTAIRPSWLRVSTGRPLCRWSSSR